MLAIVQYNACYYDKCAHYTGRERQCVCVCLWLNTGGRLCIIGAEGGGGGANG